MNNFRKVVTMLLILVLVLSLVACGPKKEEPAKEEPAKEEPAKEEPAKEEPAKEEPAKEEPAADLPFAGQEISFFAFDGGYGQEGWKAVVAAFEAATGAKVNVTYEKNLAEVVRPQIQAGDVPDLIYMSIGGEGGLTETMMKEDMILDISDVFQMKVPTEEKTVNEKLIPGFIDTHITNKDGKTYLAPLFYAPCGLYYNKGNFVEGKYTLPTTYEEFFALGEQAKADGVSLITYPTAGYFDAYLYALLLEKGGADFFDKAMNYDVDAWKSENAKYVFENVANFKDFLHPNTVSQANGELFTKNQLAVVNNEALFIPNGFWLPAEMKDAPKPEGFEWGIMPLPAVEAGGDRYSYTFFEQIFIPKDAKNPELAKNFIAYLYSDEAAKLFLEKSTAVQPIKGVVDMMTDPDQKDTFSIYETGVKPAMGGFAPAPSVEGVDVKATLLEAINSVMVGDKSAEQWQNEMVEAVTKIKEAMQ